jgi:integrase
VVKLDLAKKARKEEDTVASRTRHRPSPIREDSIIGQGIAPQRLGDRGDSSFGRGSEVFPIPRSEESPFEAPPSLPAYNTAIQDSRMTFAFFVESKFIPEHVEHKAPAGKTHYQSMLKHLLKPETVNRMFRLENPANPKLKSVPDWPYLDDVQLCDLKADHVRSLVSFAVARGYSSQTVRHIRNVLHAIISHAQRERCFSGNNPVTLVKQPPMIRKTEYNLTISQIKAILSLMEYPLKEIALLTITTGMNMVEICELQWKHINLSDSERFIDGEAVPERSIAVRARWNRTGLDDLHSGRNRDIDIPESLFPILERLRRRKSNTKAHDFVVTSQSGEPLLATCIRVPQLKPIGQKLGIPWLSWHHLRRAYTGSLSEFRAQFNHEMARVTKEEYQPGFAGAGHLGDQTAPKTTLAMESRRFCRQSGSDWRQVI